MNLENIMLNERSQMQNATYHMIPFLEFHLLTIPYYRIYLSRIGKSIETGITLMISGALEGAERDQNGDQN